MKQFFKRLAWGFLIVAGFCGLLYQNAPWLLKHYALFFTVNNAEPGADAILVLAGNPLLRVPAAVKLVEAGYAPQLFLTQERLMEVDPALQGLVLSNVSRSQAILKILNVSIPWEALPTQTPKGVTSTFDEAYDLKQYLQKTPLKRVILVTDNYHTRRALYAFEKVLQGSEVKIQVKGVGNDLFSESGWWKSDNGILVYTSETIKYLAYLFTQKNVSFIKNS